MSARARRRSAAAAFYAEHAGELERTEARRVHAPQTTIEDACQTAWSILLRRPDVTLDARGRAWLAIVATREAWRLASTAGELPAGTLASGAGALEPGELAEPPSPEDDPAARALARELYAARVEDLGALKPRERRELLLQAAGFSYVEIAHLTGTSATAVNRYLSEGRARLRARAHARTDG